MKNFTFWANVFCTLKAGWLDLVFFWKHNVFMLQCYLVFPLFSCLGWLGLPKHLTIFSRQCTFSGIWGEQSFLLPSSHECIFLFFDSYCCFSTQRLASAAVVSKGCQYCWSEEDNGDSISWYHFTFYQEIQEHREFLNTFVLNFNPVQMKL